MGYSLLISESRLRDVEDSDDIICFWCCGIFLFVGALVCVLCRYWSYRGRRRSSSSPIFLGRTRRRRFSQNGFESEIQRHSSRIRKGATALTNTTKNSPLLQKQTRIVCPLPGTFEVELREYGVTDKKSGETIGGNVTRSKLQLTFVEEEWYGTNTPCGWKIRGSRHNHLGDDADDDYDSVDKKVASSSSSGSFHAIEQGFLSPSGEAYWVERGCSASQPRVLAVVQFTPSSGDETSTGCRGFVGEFLSSENTNGKYVDCMEEFRIEFEKENKAIAGCDPSEEQQYLMDLENMSFAEMLRSVVEEFCSICLSKVRRRNHSTSLGKCRHDSDHVQIII